MTQEERELLRKDLCARLHYGVKVHLSRKHNRPEEDIVLNNVIITKNGLVVSNIIGYNYLLSEIKPYLRPMSSMTDEELKEFKRLKQMSVTVVMPNGVSLLKPTYIVDLEDDGDAMNYLYDWLNAHHFDYRGLIEKGLALEAPKGMYNIK